MAFAPPRWPELRRLEKQWPAPLWLQARLALDYEQIGLLDDAARLAAAVVAEKDDDREQLELLARFHERRHMKYDLQADYIALSRLEPNQPDIWSRLAQVQIDCGDAEGARNSLLRLVALDNGNADAHRRLAQVYEQLHLDREAQQELAAAAGTARRDAIKADAEYLVDPQALVKEAQANPPEACRLGPGGCSRSGASVQWPGPRSCAANLFLGSDAAVDAHRVSSIRYSPSTQELKVVRARVWKQRWQRASTRRNWATASWRTTPSMYYDMRSHQLRLLRPGKGRRR